MYGEKRRYTEIVHTFRIRSAYTELYDEKRNPYTEIVRKYGVIKIIISLLRIRSYTPAVYGRILSCAVVYGRIRPPYAEHQKFVAQTAEHDWNKRDNCSKLSTVSNFTLFYFILSILADINGPNQLLVSFLLYFSFFLFILGHIDRSNQLLVSVLFYFRCLLSISGHIHEPNQL